MESLEVWDRILSAPPPPDTQVSFMSPSRGIVDKPPLTKPQRLLMSSGIEN